MLKNCVLDNEWQKNLAHQKDHDCFFFQKIAYVVARTLLFQLLFNEKAFYCFPVILVIFYKYIQLDQFIGEDKNLIITIKICMEELVSTRLVFICTLFFFYPPFCRSRGEHWLQGCKWATEDKRCREIGQRWKVFCETSWWACQQKGRISRGVLCTTTQCLTWSMPCSKWPRPLKNSPKV